MSYYPSSELVAVAWTKTLDGVPTNGVGTTLPEDPAKWNENGFVQLTVVGGAPHKDMPLYRPVVQFDCWANNLNSAKVPWGKAASIADQIVWASYNEANMQKNIVIALDNFHNAMVKEVNVLTHPRRIIERGGANSEQVGGQARIQFDAEMVWVVVENG